MPGGRASTVTILFTDVVGSTARRSQLGDAVADVLDTEHERLLAGVIAASHGVVVKGLGDGIMAAFDSAADAIAAGIGLQQAVAVENRTAPDSRHTVIRVGLSAGDVTVDGDDYRGTPVVEAARLCAAANPGQVLCSELVRMLARSRTDASFVDVGTMELKGLGEPLAVCEVAWEPPTSAGAVPATLRTLERFAFVGRGPEINTLERAWKRAREGERAIVLIGGEPGLALARLATEFARSVAASGACVLAGRCEEQLDAPYQPFVEALREYTRSTATIELGSDAAELIRLWPGLAERVPALGAPSAADAATERYRLVDAVASWLAALSATAPVLLVLDDLHWAADPTLALLRHVIRAPYAMRLMVLVTYRDTEVSGHVADVVADLRRDGAERLVLGGLDPDSVIALMSAAANHELDERALALAAALQHETRGNAFFIGEVLAHLAESGAIFQSDGQWTSALDPADIPIPESVRDVVGRRLGYLSSEANDTLRAAAVVGREFELRVVGHVLGETDAVVDHLDEAMRAGLIEEVGVGEYRFAHALVRDALYDGLPVTRRARLHRAIGEAMESVFPDAPERVLGDLARHFAAAVVPGDAERAVEYARRAGHAARARRAFDEAAVYFQRAVDLDDAAPGGLNPEMRCDVLLGLAEALRWQGVERSLVVEEAARDLALEIGTADLLVRACKLNPATIDNYTLLGGVNDRQVGLLQAALAALPETDSVDRATLLAALAAEWAFAPDQRATREAMSDAAVAMARRVGDDETLSQVLHARHSVFWNPDGFEERGRAVAECLEIEERTGNVSTRTTAAELMLIYAVESGDLAAAKRAIARFDNTSRVNKSPYELFVERAPQALLHEVAGRLDAADACRAEGHELAKAVRVDTELNQMVSLYGMYLTRGRVEEIVDAVVGVAESMPDFPALAATLPYTLHLSGRTHEARDHYGRFAARDFVLPLDPGWTAGTLTLALAAAAFGTTQDAELLYDRLRGYTDRAVATGLFYLGSFHHVLGDLAAAMDRLDAARMHYEAAQAWEERMEAPIYIALALCGQAEVAARTESPGHARELASRAIAMAAPLDGGRVVQRANALLEALSA
jgi:class 3 adenylate cyclase/tetratricopeptide (TPR) repeat protein